jgi:hypothetical protein
MSNGMNSSVGVGSSKSGVSDGKSSGSSSGSGGSGSYLIG